MLHEDYNRKGSVSKKIKKESLVVSLKGLGAKTLIPTPIVAVKELLRLSRYELLLVEAGS
jgi:hypothetical protein